MCAKKGQCEVQLLTYSTRVQYSPTLGYITKVYLSTTMNFFQFFSLAATEDCKVKTTRAPKSVGPNF